MIEFEETRRGLVLQYEAEFGGPAWLLSRLRSSGKALVSRVFRFKRDDLLDDITKLDLSEVEEFVFRFRFATRDGEYFRIPGRIFRIPNDVLVASTGLEINRKLFVAERNISIPNRLSKLAQPNQEIVIGGNRDDAIPSDLYRVMLRRFPTTIELDRYARARVATVLEGFLDPLKDARREYEAYLSKHGSVLEGRTLAKSELLQSELAKYELIQATLRDWLSSSTDHSEADWQRMITNFLLLIFPKYVQVLEKVRIEDSYTTPGTKRYREIDLVLVDAGGNLDVIEVKKPFDNALLSRTLYRENNVPTKELSGTIMQAEKYLFHLVKWGVDGERALTDRYGEKLPPGMQLRITSPKAMIIMGRDRLPTGEPALSASQLFDLEVIKRKYANMIDIMTYDDLMRRLENIIVSLRARVAEDSGPTTAS